MNLASGNKTLCHVMIEHSSLEFSLEVSTYTCLVLEFEYV